MEPQRLLSVDPFIFNWPGQLRNCLRLEELLRPEYPNLVVINSDDRNEHAHWINIGNEAYYTAQLLEALARVRGEMVFLVQADAFHPEMPAIVHRARQIMAEEQVGVYAPDVDYTDYRYRRELLTPYAASCCHVPNTDITCWAFRASVLRRAVLPTVDENRYGFGVGTVICAASRLMHLAVVRDYAWKVAHPRSRGYSTSRAGAQMRAFLNDLPPDLGNEVARMRREIEAMQHPESTRDMLLGWLGRCGLLPRFSRFPGPRCPGQ